jgi:hypothetical protein
MNKLPDTIIDYIYEFSDYKENIKSYYQKNILTKIDTSLYKLNYPCFACYYREHLLNNEILNVVCLFGEHKITKEKWMSCHLLPIYNPNGKALKLYNILNENTNLFMLVYKNEFHRNELIMELYDYIERKKNYICN